MCVRAEYIAFVLIKISKLLQQGDKMNTFFLNNQELAWTLTLFFAWFFGELGQCITKIPKISFYMIFGFILSKYQLGVLHSINNSGILLLINIIAGLILFEFGYRINLSWLKNNPMIIMTSIVESMLSFIVVFTISKLFSISTLISLQFAAIFMATSPFVVMYIINQKQSSGQVTERILHLTALNCIFAIFIFKLVLGMVVFQQSGSLLQAVWDGVAMLILSTLLGIVAAFSLSSLLKLIPKMSSDRTISFSLMIIVIVVVANSLLLSPTIAALIFGIVSRHRRAAMGKTQRNFGALGDLLIVVLFVVTPLNLNWHDMATLPILAIALFAGRLLTKVLIVAIFSRIDGISWTKGALTGLALTPISIFPVLLLDQSQFLGLTLNQDLVVVSALILFLDIMGPIIVQYSLTKAKESI